MSKRTKTLESLVVGKTYECCNYDLIFSALFLTPISIDLEKRILVYEDAARQQQTKVFKNHADESSFFYVMNPHLAQGGK